MAEEEKERQVLEIGLEAWMGLGCRWLGEGMALQHRLFSAANVVRLRT